MYFRNCGTLKPFLRKVRNFIFNMFTKYNEFRIMLEIFKGIISSGSVRLRESITTEYISKGGIFHWATRIEFSWLKMRNLKNVTMYKSR